MAVTPEKPTQAVEDYIKAVYVLIERGAKVTTTALANYIEVTPSSVSAMLTRLRNLGLIIHRPFSEVGLTDAGLQLALHVVRRRRLIELFLIESLGYAWDEVEQEAEVLSRAASDVFVARIDERLSYPTVDPHGDPIPTPDGQIVVAPNHLLASLDPGATGRLVRVWNGDPEVLQYLDSCGIQLGDRIEVLRREPFGGPLVIRVGEPKDGRIHGFGHGLAEVLSIELDR
jgi:DtxR family transcriptional regulator, Mn-dependent transcriptional regulator